jgi:hypothetical protein
MGLLGKNDSVPRWVDSTALSWTPEEPLPPVADFGSQAPASLLGKIRAFFARASSPRWVDSPELTWTPYEPMNLAPRFARIRRNNRR